MYGLETLRLLLKHWRVNVTENGETKSLAFEGVLFANKIGMVEHRNRTVKSDEWKDGWTIIERTCV